MSEVPEVYTQQLVSSGRLKMRATARLAEGTDASIFEGAVLLHEAARVERRAVEALASCPATTRLTAVVEECFCLVDGRDPVGAARVWERVLRAREAVDPAVASAVLARLDPRYRASQRAFQTLVTGRKALVRRLYAGDGVPASSTERSAELRDVRRVLKDFPGVAPFWWRAYRLLEAAGEASKAWEALTNARRLEPENPRFTAVSLVLALKIMSPSDADAYVRQIWAGLDDAQPEVCLLYAHAELELAEKGDAHARWLRAADALDRGLAGARAGSLSRHLRATRLIVENLLAGREPTIEILYRVGLGEMVAMAPPQGDVIALVARMARRQINNADTQQAA